jgi:hypothetical protein
MSRRALALSLPAIVGGNLLRISDPRRGWPAFADVQTTRGRISIVLYVAPIGRSHRARDAIERRFQNPGSGRPIVPVEGAIPLLLGVWSEEGPPILVAMNAMRRLGKGTRQSLFMPLEILRAARRGGWAEHNSTSQEYVVAFAPQLLPSYVERLADAQADTGWPTARR